MCEALRELMKDEIQADIEKAERETGIKTRFEDGMSVDQIAKKSNISLTYTIVGGSSLIVLNRLFFLRNYTTCLYRRLKAQSMIR